MHSSINKENKPVVVIVLGMHRSGTSCLVGSLEQFGVFLGEVKTYSPFNKKGNRESPLIFRFHESIFIENGGKWSDPPEEIVWKPEYDKKIFNILELFKGEPVWGFKDPRTLFFIEEWLKILGDDFEVKLVGSYRHPVKVAESLFKRNGLSLENGLKVWVAYNKRLLQVCTSNDIKLINFDLPRDEYIEKLEGIAEYLSLPANDFSSFYEEGLVTVSDESVTRRLSLPSDVSQVYQKLLSYE